MRGELVNLNIKAYNKRSSDFKMFTLRAASASYTSCQPTSNLLALYNHTNQQNHLTTSLPNKTFFKIFFIKGGAK